MAQEVREGSVSSYVYSPAEAYMALARVDAVFADGSAVRSNISPHSRISVYHFHTDIAGTPLELTDDVGGLAWVGRYSAWGKVGEGQEYVSLDSTKQPLRFAGQYADTSTGLFYNTFRYYDPDVGRYLTQDPIGIAGGTNLYQYTRNATGWIDPFGWASLGQLGTYGSLNSGINVGDGLQAHELIRHEYLYELSLAGKARLEGNPSIALDLDHHTRGPLKDSRGIGGAHYHESRIRARFGLGPNEFHPQTKVELDITQGALRKAGMSSSHVRRLRKQANRFIRKLSTGC